MNIVLHLMFKQILLVQQQQQQLQLRMFYFLNIFIELIRSLK
jgi:hypothetical protein